MKKKMFAGALVLMAVVSTGTFHGTQSAITGKVTPSEAADIIWIIGMKDSVKAGLASGNFSVSVKPGSYKLIVDARDPYKDVLLDNLDVKQNQTFDVGEIILQQ